MRHTILVATLSSVAASVITTAVISGSIFGADTASSADTPVEAAVAVSPGAVGSILQGDVDCGGNVTPVDSLKTLRHDAGLSVQQDEPCPDIATVIPAGVSGVELVTGSSSYDSTDIKIANAVCPAGKRAIGGGATILGQGLGLVAITSSSPFSDLGGWGASANEMNLTGNSWRVEASAVCANVAD